MHCKVQVGLTLRVHAMQRWLAAHLCDKFIPLSHQFCSLCLLFAPLFFQRRLFLSRYLRLSRYLCLSRHFLLMCYFCISQTPFQIIQHGCVGVNRTNACYIVFRRTEIFIVQRRVKHQRIACEDAVQTRCRTRMIRHQFQDFLILLPGIVSGWTRQTIRRQVRLCTSQQSRYLPFSSLFFQRRLFLPRDLCRLFSPLFLDIIINHNTSHSQECEHTHHCPKHLATAFPMLFFFRRGVLGTRRDRRRRAFRL